MSSPYYYRDYETNEIYEDNIALDLKLNGYLQCQDSLNYPFNSSDPLSDPIEELQLFAGKDNQIKFYEFDSEIMEESLSDTTYLKSNDSLTSFSSSPDITFDNVLEELLSTETEMVFDFNTNESEPAPIMNSPGSPDVSEIDFNDVLNELEQDFRNSQEFNKIVESNNEITSEASESEIEMEFKSTNDNLTDCNICQSETNVSGKISKPSHITSNKNNTSMEISQKKKNQLEKSVEPKSGEKITDILKQYRNGPIHKKGYRCHHCEKWFLSLNSLLLHYESQNVLHDLKYKCVVESCAFNAIGFAKKNDIRRHLILEHFDKGAFKIRCNNDDEKIIIEELLYFCSVCPRVFYRRDSMTRHEKIHKPVTKAATGKP